MRIVIAFMMFVSSLSVFGQMTIKEQEKHPIDEQREACHNTSANQTTQSMMVCENEAAEAWDKELNKYYKDLMALLNKAEKTKLRIAQRKWIEYRDLGLDFSGTTYYNLQGSMWRVVSAGRRCQITRTRALELKAYYESLKGY